eukprot:5487928-Alexandrium_andersonii.AAC.1
MAAATGQGSGGRDAGGSRRRQPFKAWRAPLRKRLAPRPNRSQTWQKAAKALHPSGGLSPSRTR